MDCQTLNKNLTNYTFMASQVNHKNSHKQPLQKKTETGKVSTANIQLFQQGECISGTKRISRFIQQKLESNN
ncbi:hypothetical protein L1987_18675 [Smallanthus sonchifolius]|uniref:Uncharacterized protein n=1 Tax=Smallanthus sonchifolius TaxID=185202 RepID=A0ACB9J2D7_9ASTR|nr:hypothetical protein L1987_18675 [Smallanthus sonchifolius]